MAGLDKFGIPNEQLPDQREAKASAGATYVPPAAGLARMRFVGYIETGIHSKTFKGSEKEVPQVTLLFELGGKKHPPRDIDGKQVPHIIRCDFTLSLAEKAHFYKVFCNMNAGKQYTHMAQMLGQSFLGTIFHDVVPKRGGKAGETSTFATLRKEDGSYTIVPPYIIDPDTDEQKHVPCTEPLSPIRCFIWDYANKEQWDSIFIDGEHEGRSFNVYQKAIREALNFQGSPIQELLLGGGTSNIPSTVVDEDPLDGI